LRVADLIKPTDKPSVLSGASVKEAIMEITKKRLGAVAVLNEANEVLGIITDGDVRRMLEKYDSFSDLSANDIMGNSPKTVAYEALAVQAFELMRQHNINQLISVEDGKYAGIVHLQDLVREGII
jgi:arabinose-5-phosphate isomerase